MFEVVKNIGYDIATLRMRYESVSKHLTKQAALEQIEKLSKRKQRKEWPYRPEMVHVAMTEYKIFMTASQKARRSRKLIWSGLSEYIQEK